MNEVKIPSMTSEKVQNYLYQLGTLCNGHGNVVELGSWLGGTIIPMLHGLEYSGFKKEVWCFERWIANAEQVRKAKEQGFELQEGEDTRKLFEELVNGVETGIQVKTVKGNLPDTLVHYTGGPIEICIFDAPKTEPVFTGCIKQLKKYWIPGVTVLGLLDCKFWERHTGKKRKRFRAPVDFMEKYGDHFSVISEWGDECPVFFKYKKEFNI